MAMASLCAGLVAAATLVGCAPAEPPTAAETVPLLAAPQSAGDLAPQAAISAVASAEKTRLVFDDADAKIWVAEGLDGEVCAIMVPSGDYGSGTHCAPTFLIADSGTHGGVELGASPAIDVVILPPDTTLDSIEGAIASLATSGITARLSAYAKVLRLEYPDTWTDYPLVEFTHADGTTFQVEGL